MKDQEIQLSSPDKPSLRVNVGEASWIHLDRDEMRCYTELPSQQKIMTHEDLSLPAAELSFEDLIGAYDMLLDREIMERASNDG